jgi:hypothetical protein
MALIQSQSAKFALMWFLAAPLGEKIRWLLRVTGKPQRVVKWLGYRIRATMKAR